MGEGKSPLSPLSRQRPGLPSSPLRTVEVILSMSVTVDYSQLLLGRTAVENLHKAHPDIQIKYHTQGELCTLWGSYSQVQAALAQLLGLSGGPGSAERMDAVNSASCDSSAVHTAQRNHALESGGQRRSPNDRRERTEQVYIDRHAEDHSSSLHRDLTSRGHSWEDTGQSEGGAMALQLPEDSPMVEEDFSLIMDADMFQYLQKHCGKEYRDILSQYGVAAVDVTAEGVTTLFLHIETGVEEVSQKLEGLRLARGELSNLYQENETKIRRAQLSKSILFPRGGLQRVMDDIHVRLPKLLLNEDDQNIYIIGSSEDVSEAKQFLLLGHSGPKRVAEDAASLLRSPSFDSGSSKRAEEKRTPFVLPSTAGSLNGRIDKMLEPDEDERRTEGARRYKLAARFKDSGLGGLGIRPGDFTSAGVSSPTIRTGLGPMLGRDVLSETTKLADDVLSRAIPQNTGGDILFKNGETQVSSTSSQNTPSLTPTSSGTRHRFTTAPLSTTQTTALPATGSGSSLKRASSFSGTSRPKAEVVGQSQVQEDAGKTVTRVRGRSSSFSNRAGKDRREVSTADIAVSRVMWQYMKEVYGTLLEDMTTHLQMKERHSEASHALTVILTGVDSSRVSACQLGLQKLVAMVAHDFTVEQLRLSELGVFDSGDETLEVCCAEVRSRFKKVVIQKFKDTIFLQGPKHLCFQVGAALREVFSGAPGPENHSIPTPVNEEQYHSDTNATLYHSNNPQQKLDNQLVEDDGFDHEKKSVQRGERRRDSETQPLNGSVNLPTRNNPVIKEKVRCATAMQADGQKVDQFTSHPSKGNDTNVKPVNGVRSVQTGQDPAAHQEESNTQSKVTQKEKRQHEGPQSREKPGGSLTRHSPGRSSQRGLGGLCVCEESGASVKRQNCGVTLCPKCLPVLHVHCRVCSKTEQMSQGIRGTMSFSELHISLPGHSKFCTVKITYCIPNGIQGEGHPSPGLPFQGGLFEAYLPLCEMTKKLLPRLKEAFNLGLTFTVDGQAPGAKVCWDGIPHKTSLQGGKSGNGYPDSSYLTRLSEVLTSHGIDEAPAKSQD
ncbi:uncharacterized protein ACJ7VT_021547 isoform 2-T4 [Polymixia lowei]